MITYPPLTNPNGRISLYLYITPPLFAKNSSTSCTHYISNSMQPPRIGKGKVTYDVPAQYGGHTEYLCTGEEYGSGTSEQRLALPTASFYFEFFLWIFFWPSGHHKYTLPWRAGVDEWWRWISSLLFSPKACVLILTVETNPKSPAYPPHMWPSGTTNHIHKWYAHLLTSRRGGGS